MTHDEGRTGSTTNATGRVSWTQPAVRRIRAGDAENSVTGDGDSAVVLS